MNKEENLKDIDDQREKEQLEYMINETRSGKNNFSDYVYVADILIRLGFCELADKNLASDHDLEEYMECKRFFEKLDVLKTLKSHGKNIFEKYGLKF